MARLTLPRGSRRAAAVIVLLVVLPSCGVNGLNFQQDDRLTFIAPGDRAEVDLPLTVAWRVSGFEVTGSDGNDRRDAGYFGVFVDRAPQPPEKTQQWLVRDDQQCRDVESCPREYLEQLNIHSTTRTRFVIQRLPEPASNAQRRREFHEVTIVLLNGRGERIGESAFTRQFEVDRGP